MSDNSSPKIFQRVVTIVSGLALLATMTVAGFSFRQPSSEQPIDSNNPTLDEQLQSMVQGYETVLKREPDNPTAKQGLEQALKTLVATQIQGKDLDKAIPPMEKLVKLAPDNQEYQSVLKQMKQAQNQASAPSPNTNQAPANPNPTSSPEPLNLNLIPNFDSLNPNPAPSPDPLNRDPVTNPDPLNLNSQPQSNPNL
ncbi:tetratricopeptide repeat protein [Crocosphaera sp. UHCC 0190]|uniref:tetratricopeptide repeat protein n=1 Tax=Crocosphaera sp. UHCC 0190 TaxID=3110246 RepID=UPI002B220277|nr:tetratricopeptide repeat protein [Crocosphaera sp. UHCC 0190]MEA5510533.1 tetratricopeptide repeat protein [Crocosphaera sp. UHCC 0190]